MEMMETPEERDLRRRANTFRRVKILSVVCLLTIVARIFIKPPPPRKSPLHNDKPFRAIPGVLNNLSERDKAKLDPVLIAKLKEADEKAITEFTQSKEALAKKQETYKAIQTAMVNVEDQQATKEQLFMFEQRRQKQLEARQERMEPVDTSKKMLVHFRRGGTVKAEQASYETDKVRIVVNRSLQARVPKSMVNTISENAVTWKEPIPTGYQEIKPAPGITMVVEKSIVKRITFQKPKIRES
jgi:hypothetical protein